MALSKPHPDEKIRQALFNGVSELSRPNDRLARNLVRAPVALHVFTLGIDDITSGKGLSAARSAGWRFLSGETNGPAIAGDVIEPVAGGPPRFSNLSRDPLIGRAIEAVEEIENLPEVRGENFELRVLRIPGLLIEAFWLKSTQGRPDWIVPVLTRSSYLKPKHNYVADEFFGIAHTIAKQFLEFEAKAD